MNSPGSARFELHDILGQGGMGVVYDAYDHERGMRIALKRLRNVDAASVYHFKREFRALRDLSHPNIIELYELVAEGDDWYLTMERVDGENLIAYVRGGRSSMPSNPASRGDISEDTHTAETRTVPPSGRMPTFDELGQAPVFGRPRPPIEPRHIDDIVDLGRLRECLSQLAHALYALHSAGMVHRDLKPSNVFVTGSGRVVLMDFGVVADRELSDASDSKRFVGTPAFMAPEQVLGQEATPRADWYAYGVLMYLALSGHLPYIGSVSQLLRAKVELPPIPLAAFAHAVPDDLDSLCMRLLAIDPDDRPRDHEILEVLGVRDEHAPFSGDSTFHGSDIFVGRSAELALLNAAYADALAGDTISVIVEAPSGMGKTSLLTRFVELLEERTSDRPSILEGRCQESENLSYKAFDGVIDALSAQLMALDETAQKSLEPPGVNALTRIFPVLERIPGWSSQAAVADLAAHELRAQAVDALRVLLARLAERQPVVIRIDDIHWADRDSVALLLGILERPAPRRLLVLCALCLDTHDDSSKNAITNMLHTLDASGAARRITLGPLEDNEERALINALAVQRGIFDGIGDFLWQDAGGHPMLLAELVRYAMDAPDEASQSVGLGLEDVMHKRIARLPDDARSLLEIMAIAGEPLPVFVLADAGRVPGVERERSVSILRITHLARTVRKHGNQRWLDVYHDKVRETVLSYMSVSRSRAAHRRLARALQSWPAANPSSLARHWLTSGDRRRAAGYLVMAAQRAVESLAIDHAAQLFRAADAILEDLSQPGTPDPQLEITRCRSWIGRVQTSRADDNPEVSLLLLDMAHPLAMAHELEVELANIHVLRGHIHLAAGQLERGLEEYATGYVHAQRSDESASQAQALCGLGHTHFLRGHVAAAHEHYQRGITLARRDGLEGIAISTLPARAMTHYYHTDIDAALDDSRAALDAARTLHLRRVELLSRTVLGFISLENGRFDTAEVELRVALELARRSSSARGFELALVALVARHGHVTGASDVGAPAIERALAESTSTSVRFAGAVALGTLALLAPDESTRARVLARGEELLANESVGHGRRFFYRDAIDASFRAGDATGMAHYTSLLDQCTRDDDMPWGRLLVARARVLVERVHGQPGEHHEREREELREKLASVGLALAARDLE